MTVANRSVPDASVIPVIVYPDVGEAVEWLCGTFGDWGGVLADP